MEWSLLCVFFLCGISSINAGCTDTVDCKPFAYACGESRYRVWIKKNCRETCGLCPTPPPTYAPHPEGCGTPDIQGIRVIGGKEAVRGSWPWQILLSFNGRAMCGGTLISPEWVITAAHCVFGREDVPHYFSIRVGEYDRTIPEGSEAFVRASLIITHPKYNPYRHNNDIALIKLSKPVTMNKYVKPICLPTKTPEPGTECYITGWGKIRHPGYMTDILQQGMLPVVSNEQCNKLNKKNIGIPITDSMICGGDSGLTRKSGCHGDSGGPYVCNINGGWEIHGAVSFGSSNCASDQAYTVFARVIHFRPWIEDMIRRY